MPYISDGDSSSSEHVNGFSRSNSISNVSRASGRESEREMKRKENGLALKGGERRDFYLTPLLEFISPEVIDFELRSGPSTLLCHEYGRRTVHSTKIGIGPDSDRTVLI